LVVGIKVMEDSKTFFDLYITKGGSWENAKIKIFGSYNETVLEIIKSIIKYDNASNFTRNDLKEITKYHLPVDGLYCIFISFGKIFKVSNFSPEDQDQFFNGKSYKFWHQLNEQFDSNYKARSATETAKFNKANANQDMSQLSYRMYNVDEKLPNVLPGEFLYHANNAFRDQAQIDAQKNGIGIAQIYN